MFWASIVIGLLGQDDDRNTIVPFDEKPVKASFLKPEYKLVTVDPSSGPRMSPHFPDLMLQKGSHLHPIHSLVDLKGVVTIDTPSKALEFVRLPGSLLNIMQGPGLEVMVSEETFPGEHKTVAEGWSGHVWSRRAVEFASHYPIIRKTGSSYKITRLVIEGPQGKVTLHTIVESVTPQGAYRLRSIHRLTKPAWFAHLGWFIEGLK